LSGAVADRLAGLRRWNAPLTPEPGVPTFLPVILIEIHFVSFAGFC
jgi:hypothetical protein